MRRVVEPELVLSGADCAVLARFVRKSLAGLERGVVLTEEQRRVAGEVEAMAAEWAAGRIGRGADLPFGPIGRPLVGSCATVRWLTTGEVAARLQVSERHARRLRKEQRWAVKTKGRGVLISEVSVCEYESGRERGDGDAVGGDQV